MRNIDLPNAFGFQPVSTHILSVRISVANSEFQELQTVDIDVGARLETDPLITELRRAWSAETDRLLAQAKKDPGDLFALG